MKRPHCFLELRMTSQYDKEIDQCPKCDGIWLDKNTLENIFDFTDDNQKRQRAKDLQDTVDENDDYKLQNDYYYYIKHLRKMKNLMICSILNN